MKRKKIMKDWEFKMYAISQGCNVQEDYETFTITDEYATRASKYVTKKQHYFANLILNF